MFVFPLRTNSPVRRIPYVNYALIVANTLIYLCVDVLGSDGRGGWGDAFKQPLMLWPNDLAVHQFLTYQFLHGDRWHLLANMFFLWLFGNSVNAKMGNATYLLFYLAAGVFAGLGFATTGSDAPCVGASGSIAGVTTAFLTLFPRAEVTVFYWFFFVGTAQISALVWILGKMILWDNYIAMEIEGELTSVAYEAHLAGYLYGFVVCLGMLAARALPRDQFDLAAVLRRWYQRQTFAAAMQDPQARARAELGRVARVAADDVDGAAGDEFPAANLTETARRQIAALLGQGQFNAAAETYTQLVKRQPGAILSRPHQLAVANQLMSEGRHSEAADAYEKYVAAYPTAADRDQVRLLLGIVYARYLKRFDLARQHLSTTLAGLTDARLRDQAQHWLEIAAAPPPAAG